MREKDKKLLRDLTAEHRWAVRAAFKLWVQTARVADYEPIKDWSNFENEVDHSALLDRILLGNDPLEKPPPKAFSYPWYQLHETEYAENCEVWIPQKKDWGKYWRPDDIVINQSHWQIVRRISDEEYIVRWKDDYPLYRVWKTNRSEISHFGWNIEKVNDAP